jgi:hypothetical protein
MSAELCQGSDWLDDDPAVRSGEAVLASAEGGDRLLRMLAAGPRRLAIVDRRRAQLHLAELKLSALRALARPEYLELAGLRPSRRRRALFQRVRWLLSREADAFWLSRLGLIDRGVASQGDFERRLASFRCFVRWVHGGRKVARFQALAGEAERRSMYAGEWQTFLWREFGGMLWRRWFDVPPARLERLLLEGRLLAPPPEIPDGTFEAAKAMAPRAILVPETPEAYLRSLPDASIDAFALGRLGPAGLERELARVAAPGARISFVSERAEPAIEGVVPRGARDAGFFPGWLVAGAFAA